MLVLRNALTVAAGTGEVLTITYNGGSRPGQPRDIVVITVTNDMLIAVEPGLTAQKHFKLSRIACIELTGGQRIVNSECPVFSNVPRFDSLAEYAAHFSAEFTETGWHICQNETSYALAARFKNGKPRKTPSVSIHYFEIVNATSDLEIFIGFDSGAIERTMTKQAGSKRPWRVDSWRFNQGKTFSNLQHAFQSFFEEARASDPYRKG